MTALKTRGESVRIRPESYAKIRAIAQRHDVSVGRAIDMLVAGWHLLTKEQRTETFAPGETSPRRTRSSAA